MATTHGISEMSTLGVRTINEVATLAQKGYSLLQDKIHSVSEKLRQACSQNCPTITRWAETAKNTVQNFVGTEDLPRVCWIITAIISSIVLFKLAPPAGIFGIICGVIISTSWCNQFSTSQLTAPSRGALAQDMPKLLLTACIGSLLSSYFSSALTSSLVFVSGVCLGNKLVHSVSGLTAERQ